MIIQTIYLDKYDWLIKVFYAIDTYYIDDILSELDELDCPIKLMETAEKAFITREPNFGFTYTRPDLHVCIVVIGLTDSAEEFQNTLDHEKGHVATHIAEYYDINPLSEQFQYLQGDIGREMFREAKRFLCEHCRDITYNFINKMKVKIVKD